MKQMHFKGHKVAGRGGTCLELTLRSQGHSGLHREFQGSQDYIAGLFLKNNDEVSKGKQQNSCVAGMNLARPSRVWPCLEFCTVVMKFLPPASLLLACIKTST